MFSSGSKSTIFQHSQDLLSDLAMLRHSTQQKAIPIIFIVHSLGGIVVKDALSISQQEQIYTREILPATRGVIFLGTPHRGSAVASVGEVAFRFAKLFFQDPNIKVLRGLERNSEILDRIARSFGHVLATGRIKVHSFREELDLKGISIVDTFSSTIGYLYETIGSLHANHRDMAKMSSCDDINFQRVVAVIDRWLADTEPLPVDLRSSKTNSVLPDGLIFDEEYHDCLASLNSAEARMRHENLTDAYSGTFQWIFDSKYNFSSFLSGDLASNTFWIQGKPGSGKSTLMKFALRHPHTAELLEKYHNVSWIMAAYFFHDRGTDAQKSILGFLREILYQVLMQQKLIFPLIYPQFHSSKSSELKLRSSQSLAVSRNMTGQCRDSPSISWTLNLLEEALGSIAISSNFNIGLCIFVDALDEHLGDHRNLIRILRKVSQSAQGEHFRIRVCMAGRPENVFKDAFWDCLGFAVQNLTASDIQHYTEERFRQEVSVSMTKDGKEAFSELVKEIIHKAEGVFLWVRLVCDEFVECLCEGDTIGELKRVLSALPTELGQLYTRALHRASRPQLRASVKTRYETYVMFQIVKSCRSPFSAYELLSASLFLTAGKGTHLDLQRLSREQMNRRLYSRSAGLIEIASSSDDIVLNMYMKSLAQGRYANYGVVQFIHQTVEEYVATDEGSRVIAEVSGSKPEVDGELLILRYLLSLFPFFSAGKLDLDVIEFVCRNFAFYAHWVEQNSDYIVSDLIEMETLCLSQRERPVLMWELIKRSRRGPAGSFYTSTSVSFSQPLILYAIIGLERSFDKVLKSCAADIRYEELEALLTVIAEQLMTEPSSLESNEFITGVSLEIIKALQTVLKSAIGIHHFQKLPPKFDEQMLELVSSKAIGSLAQRELLCRQWTHVRGPRLTMDLRAKLSQNIDTASDGDSSPPDTGQDPDVESDHDSTRANTIQSPTSESA